MSIKQKESFSSIVFLILFLGGIIWELLVFFHFPQQAWILGLLEGWLGSKGLVFYKDFIVSYTPILRMLMVPLHEVFGFRQETTVWLAPATSIMVLILLFFMSLRFLSGWSRIVPPLFFLLWDPFLGQNHFTPTAFLGLTVLATNFCWLIWWNHPSWGKAFLIGVFASISVFSLQIVIPLVLFLFASVIYKIFKQKRNSSSFFLMLIGFLLPPLPFFILLARDGAISNFYTWAIYYYFNGYPYTSFGKGEENTLLFLAIHTPILFLIPLLFGMLKNKPMDRFWKYAHLALFLASLAVVNWFAVFHPLRLQISLPIYSFAAGLGIQFIFRNSSKFFPFNLIILTGFILLQTLVFRSYILPLYKNKLDHYFGGRIISQLSVDDPMYGAVEWIKSNTPQDAKLFVIADQLFYFETKRLPANFRGTSNLPMAYEPLNKFGEELKQKSPDYWIIDERIWGRFHDFGYDHTTAFFKKLLSCEPIVAQIDYFSIRKHEERKELCI